MKWCVLALILIPFVFEAQKPLPKKYRKTYVGKIPGYYMHGGQELIEVGEADIKISFSKTELEVTVGKKTYTGSYTAKREKKIFILTSEMDKMHINEIIELNRKTKTLLRKGVSPQPDALLELQRD